MSDLLEQMQRSSRGWRCAACFAQGKITQHRPDGTLLDEDDRCPGCGETICSRHPMPVDRKATHGVRIHTLVSEARTPAGT